MKKFTIIALGCVFALMANAQSTFKPVQANVLKPMTQLPAAKESKMIALPKEESAKLKAAKATYVKTHKNIKHAAPTTEELSGTYLQDVLEESETYGYSLNFCSSAELAARDTTIENESYTLVTMSGLCAGEADVEGYYFPEEEKIYVPCQVAGTYDDYGDYIIVAISGENYKTYTADDGNEYYDALEFSVIEDGDDFYIALDDDGWSLVLTSGTYAGYYLDMSDQLILNRPNAVCEYATNEVNDAGTALMGWEDQDPLNMYIELYDDGQVIFHNFPNPLLNGLNSTVEGTVDFDNMTFTLPGGYDCYYYSSYGTIHMYNGSDDDSEADLNGFITDDGTFILGEKVLDEETGEWAGNYYPSVYYPGLEDGRWFGFYVGCFIITPNEPLLNDIKGVYSKSTAAEGVNYNLAGQKVAKNYKGIVINNGKKYLNM